MGQQAIANASSGQIYKSDINIEEAESYRRYRYLYKLSGSQRKWRATTNGHDDDVESVCTESNANGEPIHVQANICECRVVICTYALNIHGFCKVKTSMRINM